jgi:hypothetical protein
VEGAASDSIGILIAELVQARLLHRSDLTVVDRRRYAPAAERRARGLASPPGAPEAGVSPGVKWIVRPHLLPVRPEGTLVTVSLVDAATGEVSATRSAEVTDSGGPLDAARAAGDLLLTMLRESELLAHTPAGPEPWALPGAVDEVREATRLFALGLAAEDRWEWEASGSAYREALRLGGPGFTEAAQALARVARLRSGGTLGQS